MTRREALPRRRLRSLYLWHRYLGLSIAFVVLILAATGLALNHTAQLGLDEHHVAASWLLRWYGIKPDPIRAFRTRHHWLAEAGGTLYLDGEPATEVAGPLRGAAESSPFLAVVVGEDLLLLDPEGEVVERLRPGQGLPEPVLGIARTEAGVVVRGATHSWHPDAEWVRWQTYVGAPPAWSVPQDPPAALARRITRHDTARRLTWERVLLDLHTGRILGIHGPWIMDLAALGLLALALSGFWVWLQRRPRRRPAHRLP